MNLQSAQEAQPLIHVAGYIGKCGKISPWPAAPGRAPALPGLAAAPAWLPARPAWQLPAPSATASSHSSALHMLTTLGSSLHLRYHTSVCLMRLDRHSFPFTDHLQSSSSRHMIHFGCNTHLLHVPRVDRIRYISHLCGDEGLHLVGPVQQAAFPGHRCALRDHCSAWLPLPVIQNLHESKILIV